MSEVRERTRLAEPMRDDLADAFRSANQGQAGGDMLPAMTPRVGGAATDSAIANFVTAQRVAVKRDFGRIITEGQAVAAAAGDRFYYRIPFKDRKGGEERTTWVEGPSIACTMAAVSLYGNCSVEALVAKETQDAWVFAARFVDLEKGVTIVRSFQQRKGQNTGMRDGGRQQDIVFQIGQSKAMRNVVVAAIPLLVNEMHEAAKNSLVGKIAKNADAWRGRILDGLERIPVPIPRVERTIGRGSEKWTPADMARIVADMNSIHDGIVTPDDVWPPAPGEDKAAAPQQQGDRTMSEAAAAEAGPDEGGEAAQDGGEPLAETHEAAKKPAPEEKPAPANDAAPKRSGGGKKAPAADEQPAGELKFQ